MDSETESFESENESSPKRESKEPINFASIKLRESKLKLTPKTDEEENNENPELGTSSELGTSMDFQRKIEKQNPSSSNLNNNYNNTNIMPNNSTGIKSYSTNSVPKNHNSRIERLKKDYQTKMNQEKRLSFNKMISRSNEIKLDNKIQEMNDKKLNQKPMASPPPIINRRMSLSVLHLQRLMKPMKKLRRANSEPCMYSYVVKKAPDLESVVQDKLMRTMQKRFSMKVLDKKLTKKNETISPHDSSNAIENLTVIANIPKDDINYKIQEGKIFITSASISGLISYLVGMGLNIVDTIFLKDFLTTYRYFLTPMQFLAELTSVWNREMPTTDNSSLDKWQVPIRLRTVNVIKQWVAQHPYDFENKELLNELATFVEKWDDSNFKNIKVSIIESINASSCEGLNKNTDVKTLIYAIKAPEAQLVQKKAKYVIEAESMVTWLQKSLNLGSRNEAVDVAMRVVEAGFFTKKSFKDKKVAMEISERFMPIQMFEKSLYVVTTGEIKFNFLVIPSEEIARQLTLIDNDLFQKIDPQSIRAWIKDNKSIEAKRVNEFIGRFNCVSQWVASKIILTTNLKKRRLVLKKFLAIAAFLRQFGNYFTLMSVIAALNFGSVTRLTETWKALTKGELTFLDDLKELASTQNNCRNIRNAMTIADPPSVPYIALYLKDIFFIEEGNKDYTSDKKINWDKMAMIGNVFRNFQKFLHSAKKYLFAPIPFVQRHLIDGMNPFTENELYRFSKLAEPKSGEDNSNYEEKLKQMRKNKEKEINLKIGTLREDVEKNREKILTSRRAKINVSNIPETIGELEKVRKIEQTILDWTDGSDGFNLYKNNTSKKTSSKKISLNSNTATKKKK